MLKKVFVTGVDGFVGKYLVTDLFEKGYSISGTAFSFTDNQDFKYLNSIVEIQKIDLLDTNKLSEFLFKENPDAIIHLAAQSSIPNSWENPNQTFSINIIGTNPLPFSATYGVNEAYKSFSSINEIVKKINQLPNIDEAVFPSGLINKFDKISRNILSFSFLLGLFRKFEWVDLIVYKITNDVNYIDMNHISNDTRIRIKAKLRKSVWTKHYPNKLMGGCLVCDDIIE